MKSKHCENCLKYYELRQYHIQDKSLNNCIGFCTYQHQLVSFDDNCAEHSEKRTVVCGTCYNMRKRRNEKNDRNNHKTEKM